MLWTKSHTLFSCPFRKQVSLTMKLVCKKEQNLELLGLESPFNSV